MKLFTYPNEPAGGQRLFHYLKTLDIPWTKDPLDESITHVMHYNYANRVDECPMPLRVVNKFVDGPIINSHLLNIKKDFLDTVFRSVFGYSVMVEDVTTFRGMIYQSSTQNAIHLHKLIQGPIPKEQIDKRPRPSHSGEPHYRIYKKWIDTRVDPETIRDFRVVIMGGKPVLLMEKLMDYRCTSHPKKGYRFEVHPHKTLDRYFSGDEQHKIERWASGMGCDFGEADILRDNSTGLMYIVDLNPVPAGAALNKMGDEVIQYLSDKFKEAHLC